MMASASYFSVHLTEINCSLILMIFSVLTVCQGVTHPYQVINEITTEYQLPDLPFDYGDLEPYVDLETVRVHHLGHHAGYTRKLNAALQLWRGEERETYVASSILTLLQNLDDIPEKYRQNIRNNGGGFVNHNLYWSTMRANPRNETTGPSGPLLDDITASFGSFEEFQQQFSGQALKLFGSGYVWLSRRRSASDLVITTTANQDSPISDGLQPILVLDVWEHAYYLKHQFRRANHVADWWRVTDWSAVARLSDWWSHRGNVHEEL